VLAMSVAPKKSTTYAERVGQLIRMLGSDREGERHAALGALNRTLKSAGLDFHVIANAIEPLNDQLDFHAEMTRIYDAGLAASVSNTEKTSSLDFNTFRDIDGKVTWQTMALYCQENRDQLRQDNHKEFVADMAAKTSNDNFGRGLTSKQMSYLQSLYFKLGGKP
jgi:hypothetical protein